MKIEKHAKYKFSQHKELRSSKNVNILHVSYAGLTNSEPHKDLV